MSGAIAQPTTLRANRSGTTARYSQIQPAAARSDVGDVSDPRWVGPHRIELTIEHVGSDRQCMSAVGGVYELALPRRAQAMRAHQTAHAIAARYDASQGHCRPETTACVSTTTGGECSFQMHAGLAYWRRDLPAFACGVVASAADLQHPAELLHRHGVVLVLQPLDELEAHRSSRAKKAEAFFNVSTSPRSCSFSAWS